MKIINFLLKSSADPRAVSLTVKGILLSLIPYALHSLELVCAFGAQCYSLDANVLEVAIEAIADGVFYGLMFLSVGMTFWGALRKVWRTLSGKNLAIK